MTTPENADVCPFPIARVDGDPSGLNLSAMTNPARVYVKCASPECISEARDGHVCGYHHGTIYADRTFAARTHHVIARDPDREWMCAQFRIKALSVEQAKEAARAELAKAKRDHWSLSTIGATP